MNIILLIISIVGLGYSYTTYDCPTNLKRDKYLKVLDDVCYRFYPDTLKDWHNARDVCNKAGGNLVMPKTAKINANVALALRYIYGVRTETWIGLSDEKDEGTFVWEDGTVMNFSMFHEGNGPNPHLFSDFEDCVALNIDDATWLDFRCQNSLFGIINEEKPFVCQYDVIDNVTHPLIQ